MTGQAAEAPRPFIDRDGCLLLRFVTTLKAPPGEDRLVHHAKVPREGYRTRADLGMARVTFAAEVAAKVLRKGLIYEVAGARLEVNCLTGWVEDGPWLDDILFPPDAMAIMARHVSAVLADAARARREGGRG